MDIAIILTRKYPGTLWSLSGDEYSGLTWLSESEPPTEKELTALWPTVEYEVAWEAVERARQVAYVTTSDPLFFQVQRGEATEQEWLDAVQAVKTANPYPTQPKK